MTIRRRAMYCALFGLFFSVNTYSSTTHDFTHTEAGNRLGGKESSTTRTCVFFTEFSRSTSLVVDEYAISTDSTRLPAPCLIDATSINVNWSVALAGAPHAKRIYSQVHFSGEATLLDGPPTPVSVDSIVVKLGQIKLCN